MPTTAQRPGRTKVLSSRAARAWSLPASDVFRIIVTGPADSKSASISPRSTSSAAPAARRGSRTPASRWGGSPFELACRRRHTTSPSDNRTNTPAAVLGRQGKPLGGGPSATSPAIASRLQPRRHMSARARGRTRHRVSLCRSHRLLAVRPTVQQPHGPDDPPCGGRATHRCCNEDANAQ